MIRTSLFIGMLAAVMVAGFGCTQAQEQGTQKKTAYYHDQRRVPIGSNVPKSYHDSDDQGTQSDMERENFQRVQGSLSTAGAGAVGGGGSR